VTDRRRTPGDVAGSQVREAEIDRDPARLFLFQSVRIGPVRALTIALLPWSM
jgi:hypothetical protein